MWLKSNRKVISWLRLKGRELSFVQQANHLSSFAADISEICLHALHPNLGLQSNGGVFWHFFLDTSLWDTFLQPLYQKSSCMHPNLGMLQSNGGTVHKRFELITLLPNSCQNVIIIPTGHFLITGWLDSLSLKYLRHSSFKLTVKMWQSCLI